MRREKKINKEDLELMNLAKSMELLVLFQRLPEMPHSKKGKPRLKAEDHLQWYGNPHKAMTLAIKNKKEEDFHHIRNAQPYNTHLASEINKHLSKIRSHTLASLIVEGQVCHNHGQYFSALDCYEKMALLSEENSQKTAYTCLLKNIKDLFSKDSYSFIEYMLIYLSAAQNFCSSDEERAEVSTLRSQVWSFREPPYLSSGEKSKEYGNYVHHGNACFGVKNYYGALNYYIKAAILNAEEIKYIQKKAHELLKLDLQNQQEMILIANDYYIAIQRVNPDIQIPQNFAIKNPEVALLESDEKSMDIIDSSTDLFLSSPISSIPTHSQSLSPIFSPLESNTEMLLENQHQGLSPSTLSIIPLSPFLPFTPSLSLSSPIDSSAPISLISTPSQSLLSSSENKIATAPENPQQPKSSNCTNTHSTSSFSSSISLSLSTSSSSSSLTDSSSSSSIPSTPAHSQSLIATSLNSSEKNTETLPENQEQKPESFRYKCPQENCKSVFKKEHSINRHLQAVHNIKLLCCTVASCKKKYMHQSDLNNHIKSTHHQKFHCEKCSKIFARKKNLVNHMSKKHSCLPIGHSLGSSSESKTATVLETPQQEELKSPNCSNTHSTSASSLSISLTLSTSSSSSSLTDSSSSSSIPSTPAHSQSLPATALNSSEKNTETLPENQEQKPKSPRIYQCPQKDCKRGFKKKFIMNRHLREVHSNIKSFCCTEAGCKKKYKQKSGLTVHIKFFHQNQKFHCSEKGCSKKYTDKRNLRKHMLEKHNRSLTELSLDSSSSASSSMPSTSTHSQSLPVIDLSSSESKTTMAPENPQQEPKSPSCSNTHSTSSSISLSLPTPSSSSSLTDSSSSAPISSTSTPSQSLPDLSASRTKRKMPAAMSEVNQHQEPQSPGTHPLKRFHQDFGNIPSSAICQMLYQNQLDYLAKQNALLLMSLYSQQGSNQQTREDSTHIGTPQDSSKRPESLPQKRKKPAPLARNNNRYSIVNSFPEPKIGDLVIQLESERNSKASNLGKNS